MGNNINHSVGTFTGFMKITFSPLQQRLCGLSSSRPSVGYRQGFFDRFFYLSRNNGPEKIQKLYAPESSQFFLIHPRHDVTMVSLGVHRAGEQRPGDWTVSS